MERKKDDRNASRASSSRKVSQGTNNERLPDEGKKIEVITQIDLKNLKEKKISIQHDFSKELDQKTILGILLSKQPNGNKANLLKTFLCLPITESGVYILQVKSKIKESGYSITLDISSTKVETKAETKEELKEIASIRTLQRAGTIKIGTEFTFTNERLKTEFRTIGNNVGDSDYTKLLLQKWKKKMANRPGVILDDTQTDKYNLPLLRFIYKFDEKSTEEKSSREKPYWYYQVGGDPGVLETQTFPMSLNQMGREERNYAAIIQRDIFEVASELELVPDKEYGGGHIHLDIESTFGDNEIAFRNFIVDFYNNALALEALENDPQSARVLAQMSPQARANFKKVIFEFDQSNEKGIEGMRSLARMLADGVYKPEYDKIKENTMIDRYDKYVGLSVMSLNEKPTVIELQGENIELGSTMEIRALRAQRNVDELTLLVHLFEQRIKKIIENSDRIEYKEVAMNETYSKVTHSDKAAVIEAFKKYIEQAGLVWDDYKDMADRNLAERIVKK